jgi:hypothetical protein
VGENRALILTVILLYAATVFELFAPSNSLGGALRAKRARVRAVPLALMTRSECPCEACSDGQGACGSDATAARHDDSTRRAATRRETTMLDVPGGSRPPHRPHRASHRFLLASALSARAPPAMPVRALQCCG